MPRKHRPSRGLFHRVLNAQSSTGHVEQMIDLIVSTCAEWGVVVEVDDGNVYVTKGVARLYPCIVCHTDTVHAIRSDEQYRVGVDGHLYFAFDPTTNTCTGVGGDDKVGVFIALEMIRTHRQMKAVFFRDEERGCIGAGLARMEFFADCTMVLECDRRGNRDFVDRIGGEMFGDDFRQAVTPILRRYGYGFSGGASTDVGRLKDKDLPIAAANMSCGYYNPHTSEEVINWLDVVVTWMIVRDIFAEMGHVRWNHVRQKWAGASVVVDHDRPSKKKRKHPPTEETTPVVVEKEVPENDEEDWFFDSWWQRNFPEAPDRMIRYIQRKIGYKRGSQVLLHAKASDPTVVDRLVVLWRDDTHWEVKECADCGSTDVWPTTAPMYYQGMLVDFQTRFWCRVCEQAVKVTEHDPFVDELTRLEQETPA
jgi:tripeptide aminopeptidase